MSFSNEVAERARSKGEGMIPEFKKDFPFGDTYEVYNVSTRQRVSRCTVFIEDPIPYLAQIRYERLFGLFAEINLQIDAKYCYVYYHKLNYFGIVPFLQEQRDILTELNSDFYKIWLFTKDLKFSPKEAIFNPINFVGLKQFQSGVRICDIFYHNLFKILKRQPNDLSTEINPLLKACDKAFQKAHFNTQLEEDFLSYYNKITTLNRSLSEIGRNSLKSATIGPTIGDISLAVLFGYPAVSLKIESTYIFPNYEKTLVVLLVPWSGYIPREFEHYSAFYELTKALSLGLKDIPK